MEASVNYFTELYQVDVSNHIEKKAGFSYVSWPFAIAELRKRHPSATWEICRFDGMPFLNTPLGYFVEVAVTVNGVRLSQVHPVLDNRNQPIKNPSTFQINTSIQRALVKAIALHGLGLFVYAGEDLPEEPPKAKLTQEDIARIDFVLDACPTLDELKRVFLSAHKRAADANDSEAIKHFTKTKDEVKARLEKSQ